MERSDPASIRRRLTVRRAGAGSASGAVPTRPRRPWSPPHRPFRAYSGSCLRWRATLDARLHGWAGRLRELRHTRSEPLPKTAASFRPTQSFALFRDVIARYRGSFTCMGGEFGGADV